jgi:hypothetical protein
MRALSFRSRPRPASAAVNVVLCILMMGLVGLELFRASLPV